MSNVGKCRAIIQERRQWLISCAILCLLLVFAIMSSLSQTAVVYNPAICRNCWTAGDHFLENTNIDIRNGSSSHYNGSSDASPPGKIYIISKGRLGNVLFQYTMLLSLKYMKGRSVYLISDTNLGSYFQGISIPILKSTSSVKRKLRNLPQQKEQYPGVYMPNFTQSLPKEDAIICCYFQSSRYFHSINHLVKMELTFRDKFKVTAQNLLHAAFAKHFGETSDQECRYVGIHVRRGDMALPALYRLGYRLPKPSYFQRAKAYFKQRYPGRILFVVASDDTGWVKKNLNAPDTIISEGHTAPEDLAILAACNDTIISLSSFSWWAGFLAGGETVYFKDFKANGSRLDIRIKIEDRFFTQNWIPMGN